MKKYILPFIAVTLIVLIYLGTSFISANSQEDKKKEAKIRHQLVKDFYTAYLNHYTGDLYYKSEIEDSIKQLYCTQRLLSSLKKNLYDLPYGEGGLDSDPFTMTQDLPPDVLSRLWIGNDERRKNMYLINIGYKDTIRVVVNEENGKYKIDSLLLYNTYAGDVFF